MQRKGSCAAMQAPPTSGEPLSKTPPKSSAPHQNFCGPALNRGVLKPFFVSLRKPFPRVRPSLQQCHMQAAHSHKAVPAPRWSISPQRLPAAGFVEQVLIVPASNELPAKEKCTTLPILDSTNSLVLRGDFWEVRYQGRSAIIEDSRGLRYVACLIQQAANQHGPLHAKELVSMAKGREAVTEIGSKQAILDSAARDVLIKRMENIGFERNAAMSRNDFDTVARLDEEIDKLTAEIERNLSGRGKRTATFNGADERARKAVGKAISQTVSKLLTLQDMESFGQHLATSLQKGQWLSYNGATEWQVEFSFKSRSA